MEGSVGEVGEAKRVRVARCATETAACHFGYSFHNILAVRRSLFGRLLTQTVALVTYHILGFGQQLSVRFVVHFTHRIHTLKAIPFFKNDDTI